MSADRDGQSSGRGASGRQYEAARRAVRWALVVALLGLSGASALVRAPAVAANATLEERKLPMRFGWHVEAPSRQCEPNCRSWVSAVGLITSDTPKAFEEFARNRDLKNATVVLDSAGGSVLDAIRLGRRWRDLGVSTTLGVTVSDAAADGAAINARIMPEAHCESMCVFLLLSGVYRYVPPEAHVRVHQIWMGDRADNARNASYTAEDLMIIQRDLGRLANYAFEMGASGDLIRLSLSVPPWEPLHELTKDELRRTGLISVDTVAGLFRHPPAPALADVSVTTKTFNDRAPVDATRTAEAAPRSGSAAP